MMQSRASTDSRGFSYVTCSECGKKFPRPLSYKDYQYKTSYISPDEDCRGRIQCSYTCYDHALLRSASKRSSVHNYKVLVVRCENMMKSQGKTILHPIKL